jgi:LacI family transcriptional regulator
VLAGPADLLTARDRHAGFVERLAGAGVPIDHVAAIHDEFTRDGGYVAAQELIVTGPGVTCAFASNDVMAVGAIAAFRDQGLRVPEDISIAGSTTSRPCGTWCLP